MASKITLVNKNNSAQSLKFHLFGPAQNRINVANVLNGFKASAVFMEDDTLMEADDNVLSVDTFTTRSTYTVIIIPIHGRSFFLYLACCNANVLKMYDFADRDHCTCIH